MPNTSAAYDFQRWDATSRFSAAQHIGTGTREQPRALVEIEAEPDVRLLTGGGRSDHLLGSVAALLGAPADARASASISAP